MAQETCTYFLILILYLPLLHFLGFCSSALGLAQLILCQLAVHPSHSAQFTACTWASLKRDNSKLLGQMCCPMQCMRTRKLVGAMRSHLQDNGPSGGKAGDRKQAPDSSPELQGLPTL